MKSAMLTAVFLLIPSLLFAAALETAFLPDGTEYLVDRFIITTTTDTPALEIGDVVAGNAFTGVTQIDNLCARYQVTEVEPFYSGPVRMAGLRDLIPRMYILHVAPGADVRSAQSAFKGLPAIETSDLYDIPRLCYEPDDPSRGQQYHIGRIQGYEAWDIIRGDSTRAAIVAIDDTGVYWMHPDLAANMWINEPEDLNGNGTMDNDDFNGLDDDGNGYIDDVIGWDLGVNDNDPREQSPTHGTHVAGCASEVTDNGILGAGIGFSARIMAVKGANAANQLTAVYPAMIWAAENGAHIVNCSWGSTYYNSGYQNIINGLWSEGVIVVAAAGNEGNSQNFYPAAYNNVLAVAATNAGDIVPYWSSYGTYVDVCAPGVGVYSTWATGSFLSLDGTSMASPITSGTCALLKAAHMDWTNDDIVQTIIMTADNIDDLNPGYEGLLGSGRINAYSALGSSLMPNIEVEDQSITITDDDGDGVLNPGESFELVVDLHNYWQDAVNVTGTLLSDDNFSVTDSTADFGTIGRGQTRDNSDDPYTVTSSGEAPLGTLMIGLRVEADGYQNDLEVPVYLSLNQAGFPLEIPGQIESSPLIYDVDQNGTKELIFGANDDKVYILEPDGQNLPGWPKSTSGDVITGPAVGDLADNGTNQVVAVSKNGSIYAWNADGTLMPNFPISLGGIFFAGVSLVDIDGDGDLEIVTGSFTDNNIYVFHHDGSPAEGWPITGGKWYASASSADIDGDNLSEIIYAGFDSSIYAFNGDGGNVPGFPIHLDGVGWASCPVGDVDGDMMPEIVAVTGSGSLYLFNNDGSLVPGFPVNYGSILKSPPSLADINGDGRPEIILGTNDAMVHVVNAQGSEISGFPQATDGAISGTPVVGDINGDGQLGIIVGTGGGKLYGFAPNGAALGNFPIPGSTSGPITGTPALGDLDDDGDMEIAVGIKGTGPNLLVIDYKSQIQNEYMPWPFYGRNSWRNCDYTDVLTSVDDDPSKPIRFALAQNYPNPFNAHTTIRFSLTQAGEATLSIFDLLGRRIRVLDSGFMNPGEHSVVWNGRSDAGSEVASGIYFYRLESPDGSRTRRMLYLK